MKNVMKKIAVALSVVTISAMCAGCSVPGTGNGEGGSGFSIGGSNLETYTYTENADGNECSDVNETIYTLSLLNDSEAKLEIQNIYSKSNYTTTNYTGRFERDGEDTIVFIYEYDENDDPMGCGDDSFGYVFTIENGKATNVIYGKNEFGEYAGTYTGSSEELGSMTLTIEKSGTASLETPAETLTGSVVIIDGRLDLMVSNNPEGDEVYNSYDWYIDLDGDTFTYEPYQTSTYKEYAGSFSATGELGEIKFECDDMGGVTCSVNYNGQNLILCGNYSYDDEAKRVTYVSVYNDLGYELYLNIEDLNGVLNYSGSISLPLSAG